MPPVPIERIRNIGIIAHIDAGKTTVTERILYFSGKEHRMGEVHDGNTVMDWMAEERERGITITSAATSLDWKKHRLNLIDTPGHVDFTAEVERSLRVLDGAVGVFDGVAGVEAQSETVWRQADRYDVPRLAFVNKLDRMGAVYEDVVEDIRERLAGDGTPAILPMIVPVGAEAGFSGIVDPLRRVLLTFDRSDRGLTVEEGPVPEELAELVEERRAAILEAAAENSDDAVMEKFLSGEELTTEEVTAGIRHGVVTRSLVPVFGGSALKDIGIQPLLDAVVAYLPSPLDAGAVEGRDPRKEDKVVRCKPEPKEPLAVLAFKTFAEQHGDLTYMRVYSGVLRPNNQVWNARRDKVERIGRILEMHADRRVAVDEAGPGSIVATVGLRFTVTGDTLCSKKAPV
ncbi:MAG: elongation factor G, partial [Planctomycetota bacterium]